MIFLASGLLGSFFFFSNSCPESFDLSVPHEFLVVVAVVVAVVVVIILNFFFPLWLYFIIRRPIVT